MCPRPRSCWKPIGCAHSLTPQRTTTSISCLAPFCTFLHFAFYSSLILVYINLTRCNDWQVLIQFARSSQVFLSLAGSHPSVCKASVRLPTTTLDIDRQTSPIRCTRSDNSPSSSLILLLILYNLATSSFGESKMPSSTSKLLITAVPGFFQQAEPETDASLFDYVRLG